MRRILLGVILPLLLLIAVGLGIWLFVRARNEASQENGGPGGAGATGVLQRAVPEVPEPPAPSNGMRARVMGDAGGAPQGIGSGGDIVSIDEDGNRFVYREETPESDAASDTPVVSIPPQTGGAGDTGSAPAASGSADDDNDGLTTDQELQQGTSPNRADTDNDGLTDGEEVRQFRTSPLNRDTDGDGLGDGEEVARWGTDPLNPDTDGDSHLDGAEIQAGYNPNGPGTL